MNSKTCGLYAFARLPHCMAGAGVVPEAFDETILRVAEMKVAGVDEVHGVLKGRYG
jgi:hypothetical protein